MEVFFDLVSPSCSSFVVVLSPPFVEFVIRLIDTSWKLSEQGRLSTSALRLTWKFSFARLVLETDLCHSGSNS